MSISSDGLFFFGLCWAEGGGLRGVLDAQRDPDATPEEDDDDPPELPDRLCIAWDGPPMPEWDEAAGDYKSDLGDYRKARDAFLAEHLAGVLVEEVLHCSYDYPMFGLAIQGTLRRACRGGPEQIDKLMVPPGSVAALGKVCEALGIDYQKAVANGRLGWWLTSLYG